MFVEQFEQHENPMRGYLRLPEPPLDEIKQKNGWQDKTNHEILTELCRQGFKSYQNQNLIPTDKKALKPYIDRIKHELATYEELHFTNYILLIFCIINKARELGVFIDYGRGSGPSSIILWLLGVSRLNPIKLGLFFERFVSKARAKNKLDEQGNLWLDAGYLPDVDLNLGEGRPPIVAWLNQLYPNRVCKILTVGTLTEKILIKDIYKIVKEATEEEAQEVSEMFAKKHGVIDSLDTTYADNPKFKEWADNNKQIVDICQRLSGLIRQKGTHASGYLVCEKQFNELMPVQRDSEGEIVSSFTMEEVPAIKADLLGLTSNSLVKNVLNATNTKLEDLNLDDDWFIYEKYQDGKLLPYGLYQISADTAYRVLNEIKPKNIQEVADVNALARPGSLAWVSEYCKGNNDPIHPLFEDIFAFTRQLPLYQEQLIKGLVKLGFTPEEAETARKIVGKKKIEEIPEWKEKIFNKAKQNGHDQKCAEVLWKVLEDSGGYSFNLSHAYTVAYMGVLTTYLKYKYSVNFYLECLKDAKSFDDISLITKELQYFDIKLLQPDLLKSEMEFIIEGKNIRYGLKNVKGISEKVSEKLINFRKQYSSKIEMFLNAKQSGISIAVLSALIQAGTMSSYEDGKSRAHLVLQANLFNILTDKEKLLIKKISEQTKESNIFVLVKKCVEELKDEKGKPLIKETRFETIRKKIKPHKDVYAQNAKNEALTNFFYENAVLGYSYSQKLAQIYKDKNPLIQSLAETKSIPDKERVLFVGIVKEVIQRKSKKNGTQYVKMVIQDEQTTLDCFLFNSNYADRIQECKDNNNGKLPQEEDVVIVSGKKKGENAVYGDSVGIQNNKVLIKLRDLKNIEKEDESE